MSEIMNLVLTQIFLYFALPVFQVLGLRSASRGTDLSARRRILNSYHMAVAGIIFGTVMFVLGCIFLPVLMTRLRVWCKIVNILISLSNQHLVPLELYCMIYLEMLLMKILQYQTIFRSCTISKFLQANARSLANSPHSCKQLKIISIFSASPHRPHKKI